MRDESKIPAVSVHLKQVALSPPVLEFDNWEMETNTENFTWTF